MATRIQFLDINKLKVLRVLRVRNDSKLINFSGYLYYTRNITKEYDSSMEDYIDEMIFSSIQKVYPDSYLVAAKNIMFKGQKEDILDSYSGKKGFDFKITFTPNIPFEKLHEAMTMNLFSYTFKFNFNNTSLFSTKEQIGYFNRHMFADIPFDKIELFHRDKEFLDFDE